MARGVPPAMKAIRYGLHFATLTVAVGVFWLAKDLTFFERFFNFNFFPFALIGALHAVSVVVSLRDRGTTHPITTFLILALCFIVLAALWSAATPIMGLWGSMLWAPIADLLNREVILIIVFLTGSAIGCSGYWFLVRLFWVKSLRRRDWLRTAVFCMAATLLSVLALDMSGVVAGGVLTPSVDITLPILTVAWWFAFSISLYWSEMSEQSNKSTQAMGTAT